MIKKLLLTSLLIGTISISSPCTGFGETFQFDVEYPDYLKESSSIDSVVCTIESMSLNKQVNRRQLFLEMAIENFTIDSGLDGFKFKLSKDNLLTFTLPESGIDITTVTYKEEVDNKKDIEHILNKSVMSFNKNMKTHAKLVSYEIERVWRFLGHSFVNNESSLPFNEYHEVEFNRVFFQEFDSVKLPTKYSEWSLDQDEKIIGLLEVNINYQQSDSVYIPRHIVINYPNPSRYLDQKGRSFDIKFYDCDTE